MKRMTVYLLATLFCCGGTSALADEGLNAIGEAFVKAFKAGDLDAVVALYAPDAVSFPPDAMAADGQASIRASWGGIFNNFEVRDLVITNARHQTEGALSAAWGNYRMILLPKAGGDEVVMEGRFTDVAKRVGNKWLYVADHASLPLPAHEPE